MVGSGWFTCRRRCRWSRVAQAPARRNDLAPGDKEEEEEEKKEGKENEEEEEEEEEEKKC